MKNKTVKLNQIGTLIVLLIAIGCAPKNTALPISKIGSPQSNGSTQSNTSNGNSTSGNTTSGNTTTSGNISSSTLTDYSGFKCDVKLDNVSAVVSVNSYGEIVGAAPTFSLQISSGTVSSRILDIRGFGVSPTNWSNGTIALAHKAEVQVSQVGTTLVLVTLVAADNESQKRTCNASALVTVDSTKVGSVTGIDYSGFGCSGYLSPASQSIRVDDKGNPLDAAPIFNLQVTTGSFLSRIISINGAGVHSTSFDTLEQSTSHWSKFSLAGVGYVPVTVTVVSASDSSQIRNCQIQPQVIAKTPLPAAPTCELKLSSTVLRVGDSFSAQLIPSGSANSGIIEGTQVPASGNTSLVAKSVGSFVAYASVTGDGGTGKCQTAYTVREKCKAPYDVNSTIGATNAPRYDVGGGVLPSGSVAAAWQSAGGNAPVLLLSGLKGGDKVELTSVTGAVHYCNPASYGWPWYACYMSCDSMGPNPASTNYPSLVPVVQFTNDAGTVQTAPVTTMYNTNAMILNTIHGVQMTVPENATRIFGGYPDSYSADNSPTSVEACSVKFHVTPKCD